MNNGGDRLFGEANVRLAFKQKIYVFQYIRNWHGYC